MCHHHLLSFLVCCVIVLGCRSLPVSPNADKNWIRDFKRADKMVLTDNGIEQTITDPKTISRLGQIYSAAKFETYWHTVPGNLGKQTIEIYAGGSKLRRLSYTGLLWEHSRDQSNGSADRTAELNDSDRQWIKSLFDAVRKGEPGSAG